MKSFDSNKGDHSSIEGYHPKSALKNSENHQSPIAMEGNIVKVPMI